MEKRAMPKKRLFSAGRGRDRVCVRSQVERRRGSNKGASIPRHRIPRRSISTRDGCPRQVPPARRPGFFANAEHGSRPRIVRPLASWNRFPARDHQGRLTELWDYEKFTPPIHEGGRYFYTYNTGLQNQSVLYTSGSIDGEASVLIDPNTLSPDGTVALSGAKVAHDGRFVAYGIAAAGSDWNEWKVPRPGLGNGFAGSVEMDQVLASRVGPGRPGLFLRAVSGAEVRPGPEGGELRTRFTIIDWARTSKTTCSCGKTASTRSPRRPNCHGRR